MTSPPSSLLVSFGQVILRRRRARALTLEALAAGCGISPSQLQAIETGRRAPRLSELVALARALDCEASELIQHAMQK